MTSAIDDTVITEDEFSAMVRVYDSTMSKIEDFRNSSILKLEIKNNNNNVSDNV
jgi:hypothetical protein